MLHKTFWEIKPAWSYILMLGYVYCVEFEHSLQHTLRQEKKINLLDFAAPYLLLNITTQNTNVITKHVIITVWGNHRFTIFKKFKFYTDKLCYQLLFLANCCSLNLECNHTLCERFCSVQFNRISGQIKFKYNFHILFHGKTRPLVTSMPKCVGSVNCLLRFRRSFSCCIFNLSNYALSRKLS